MRSEDHKVTSLRKLVKKIEKIGIYNESKLNVCSKRRKFWRLKFKDIMKPPKAYLKNGYSL